MHDRLMHVFDRSVIFSRYMNCDIGRGPRSSATESYQCDRRYAVIFSPTHGAYNIFRVSRSADRDDHVARPRHCSQLMNEDVLIANVVADCGYNFEVAAKAH